MKKSINFIISSLIFSAILFGERPGYAMKRTEDESSAAVTVRPTEHAFQGKIISSFHDCQSSCTGVTGPHHVFYPNDVEDVARAVELSRNWRTFIRSGTHTTQDDAVDGTGGIVINLKHLSDIDISGQKVKTQAGATIDVVLEKLAKNNLALPLADNPLKSISSNVLYEEGDSSCLMRSLGPLSQYVYKINRVRPDEEPVSVSRVATVRQCKESKSVVTQVKFKAEPANNLCMFRVNFPYPGQKRFRDIAKTLFNKDNCPAPIL